MQEQEVVDDLISKTQSFKNIKDQDEIESQSGK